MSAPSLKLALRYFGDYVLLDEIARGGMGAVYHARQISLDREVAVKMFHAGILAGPLFVQRFRTEAQAMAQLDHPHIVPIYEVGEHEDQHYISMKLIEGGNLAEWIEDGTTAESRTGDWRLASARAGSGITDHQSTNARLLAKIAHAVHHAHQRGVIHRDLKPGNILLDEKGEPLVADFGLARLMDSELALTQTQAGLGTPHYMSPEQAAGKSRQVTTAADIYSLGAILFELLTGRPPFQGEGRDAVIQKVIHAEPPRPSTLNSAVDRDLETICLKCLEKDPSNRYRTAEDLADDLEAWRDGEPIQARPVSLLERTRKWVRRKPAVAALSGALCAAVIGCIIGFFVHVRQVEHALHQRERMGNFLKEVFRGLANTTDSSKTDFTKRIRLLDAAAKHLEGDLKEPPELQADVRVALGSMYYSFGDFEKAESMYRPAASLYRSVLGSTNLELASVLNSLGVVVQKQGHRDQAEPFYREALDIWRKVLGPDDPKLDVPRENLAFLVRRLAQSGEPGRYAQAEALYREAYEVAQRRNGSNDWITASKLTLLVQIMHEQKKFSEAAPFARQAVKILETVRSNDWRTFQAQSVLGANLSAQTNYAEAETNLLNGYRGLREFTSTNSALGLLEVKQAAERLAAHYAAAGPSDRAVHWQQEFAAWSNRYAALNAAPVKRQVNVISTNE